jgi:hypothetical protein
MRRQRCIGPGRSRQSAALGAIFHPPWERRRQRLGQASWLAWGPVALSARPAMFLLVLEPEAYSRTMSPELLSNELALAPATRHQNRRRPGAEASVSGRLKERFQLRWCHSRQPDPPHRFPPSCKPVRESTPKKMHSHPLHE